ncbi:hypothetical protein [Portibacter marinus]|uniref:hypothetical protein n=1 Tax=Portibacter marinus TaxID=2898660 RepID=UPI001F186D54|nr:hypothetical protein [Portibacter marinus]
MKYLILFGIGLLFSCSQKRGCTNEFGSNFDRDAMVDCCCEFDVEKIISDLLGQHEMTETCSSQPNQYTITIERNQDSNEGIIISNFNDQNTSIEANWNSDEFKLSKDFFSSDCNVEVTGSMHLNNGKVHFIYAAIPPQLCPDYAPRTCESRAL